MTIKLLKLQEITKELNLAARVQELEDLNTDSFFMNNKIYSAGKSVEYFVEQYFSECTRKTKLALEAVLAMAIYSYTHKKWCMYSRNTKGFAEIKRYKNDSLDNRLIINVIDKLVGLQFLENKIGIKTAESKFTSRFRATESLINILKDVVLERKLICEPVIVKSESIISDYKDTKKSNQIRQDINKLNKHFIKFNWSISLSDSELLQMPTMCIKDYNIQEESQSVHHVISFSVSTRNHSIHTPFDFSKTYDIFAPQYKRIFSSNIHKFDKHEQFNLHGRFYDSTQNIPKVLRNNILINKEKTIELDYSSLHLSIIYALEGLTIPEGDLYSIESYPRNIVKQAIIIILNCSTKEESLAVLKHNENFTNYWELAKTLNNNIIGPEDLYSKLEIKHQAILKYFSSSFGLLAMFHDSCIANNILKTFVILNKPIMGIHDSFRVCIKDESLLREIMIASFQKILCTNNIPGIKQN